jgi:hypothetical protein
VYHKFIYSWLYIVLLMKKFKSIEQHVYIIVVLAILLFSSYNNQKIYGHNFAGDESASFLALMDQIQTEMNLINTNINSNNQTLAQDHLNRINELYTEHIKEEITERNERVANEISSIINEIDIALEQEIKDTSGLVKDFNDIIGEAISVRIDQEAFTNSTIQALHFADLINSIDVSYATAVGEKPMNMSAMNMSSNISHNNTISHGNNNNHMSSDIEKNHADSSTSMASMSKDIEHNSNATEISRISNIASYQTAKEITNVAIDLFNSTIKQNIPSNATENANTIESSLQQLKDLIESKDPYDKVMGVIHGPIQTNILETFNLPLKTSK